MPSDDKPLIDKHGSNKPYSRRQWLKALGVAGAVGVAGCGGGGGSNTDTPGETATDTAVGGGTTVAGFGEETETPEPTDGTGATETATGTPEPLPEVGGSYTLALSSDPTTLNAMYNTESTAGTLIRYAVEGSYGFKPGQIQFPNLFELSSDDNTVWVAKLRENLHWSDPYGDVTAEDYVYMIQELHQTDWAGTAASADWYSGGEPIPVEQTGTYEFQIELPNADPLFPKKPTTWEMMVVPKDLIQPYVESQDAKGLQKDEELMNLSYAGNLGAYDLDNWARQSRLKYSRADEYYMRDLAERDDTDVPRAFANAPYFETLEAQIIPESSSRLSAFEAGDLDELTLSPPQAVNIEGTEGIDLNLAPQPYNTPVFYNMRANGWKPFRKKGVRQALGCAINKKEFVEGIQRGYATPEYTWQPTWSPWYTDEVANGIDRYGTGDLYGPEVTRQKMSEALSDTDYGYDGDKLYNPEGNPVELDLYYQSGQDIEATIAQYIQKQFSNNAGITVNISGVQARTFDVDYFRTGVPDNASELKWSAGPYNGGPRDKVTSNKAWDIGLVYGLNTYPMTPMTNEVFFTKDGSFNPYGYYPSFDAAGLFKQANNATSEEEIQSALAEFFIEISKDQPMGMISLGVEITGYQTEVVGYEEEFFNGWNFPAWYKES
ncbi:MAG: ABC transporter substrate-binding protein [Haloarculaceae archaeon]